MLDDKQIEEYKKFFEENGYAVIPNAATSEEANELQNEAQKLVSEYFKAEESKKNVSIFTTTEQERKSDDYFLTSGDKIRFFFEENAFKDGKLVVPEMRSINKIGHALFELNETFRKFTSNPVNVQITKQIFGMKQPLVAQSMVIFKQPTVGGHVSIHQDSTFVNTKPSTTLGLWYALEDVTLENGCLWVVPKSHKEGICQRFVRNPNGPGTIMRDADKDERASWPSLQSEFDKQKFPEKWVPLTCPKGSVVLIHGNVVHMSESNHSNVSRGAYTWHMVEKDAVWSPENWLQRETPFPPLC